MKKNQTEAEQKTAADRKASWDREIAESGHSYQPTPATAALREEEIRRDEAAEAAEAAADAAEAAEAAETVEAERNAAGTGDQTAATN